MKLSTLVMLLTVGCNAYGETCYLPVSGRVVYEVDAGEQPQRIITGVGRWVPKGTDYENDDAGVDGFDDGRL